MTQSNEPKKFQLFTDMTKRALSDAANAAKESVAPSPKSIDERRAILQREVSHYVRQGYRVVSQTDTTVQLLKPKTFSFLWAFLWLLVAVVGLLVHLLYYWSKRDLTVYIEIDEHGRVKKR